MKSVIMDVDTGVDDALAIAYACRSEELQLLGFTTCFGNVPVELATVNTLYILELLGSDAPVIPGAEKPLLRTDPHPYSYHVHGENGLGNAAAPAPRRKAQRKYAPDFIWEQVCQHPHEVTLIMVGPLTNLALAIQKEPKIVDLVERVIVMGGAVQVPGNVTPVAEANIYADPEAADLVFRSGIPLTLVGLDVTMQTLLPLRHLDHWRAQNTSVSRFFADMTEFYIQAYKGFYPGIGGCALHDPLAVGAAICPGFVTEVPMHVRVETEGSSKGQTIALPDQAPNIQVCVGVDEKSFLEHFLKRVV
ncbi:nucleoside hydrolase [Marinicrinis lubricantis]|uniref:Nucleoside hydrolase n=1 Tax=Marinicrinis lubricantis TaxID=2086470 RepID=A0ABW1IJP0_9BACL